jgi:hypothetical protein
MMSAMYRLTLTPEAFALALMHSKPMAGRFAVRRPDNKWDVMITLVTQENIKAKAKPGENFSDTVVRTIKETAQ